MKYSKLFILLIASTLQLTSGYQAVKCDAPRSNGGPCRSPPKPMWTYIKARKSCLEIDYFGCPDTKNLFPSKNDCLKDCRS